MNKSQEAKAKYVREHLIAKDEFKEDTIGDEKKRVYYEGFSAGLYAGQHGKPAEHASQWEITAYNSFSLTTDKVEY